MTMRERAAAAAFLLASGLYLWGALAFPRGTPARPGPGFFPVAVGVFLCVVAAVFFVTTLLRRTNAAPPSPQPPPAPEREGEPEGMRGRFLATMAGLAGFCLLLPWTGYPLAAFLFVALLLRRLGGAGWLGTLAAAAVSAAASYYVFAVLLAVPLPRGLFLD